MENSNNVVDKQVSTSSKLGIMGAISAFLSQIFSVCCQSLSNEC